MKKITVIGDIMVEPPFMQQVKKGDTYDFYTPMQAIKSLFENSDYVIGNLETPLAGDELGYTSRIVSFNAPDSLAEALKQLGINAVSTANNHCYDRGYSGLARTIDVLDNVGIKHTGTYKKDFTGDRNHYFEIGDTKVALIAYAHSTNAGIVGDAPEGETANCVNNLRPLKGAPSIMKRLPEYYYNTLKYVQELTGRKLIWEESILLKKAMDIPFTMIDENVYLDEIQEYSKKITADYELARKNADIVLFYPHIGGQFNTQTGKYSQAFLDNCAIIGFDAIFAAHSHTTQKAQFVNGIPVFYSMGNVTMSPSTFYQVPESLPEYGLVTHLYIEDKKIQKVTFSIIKMVESETSPLKVIPVDKLYLQLDQEGKENLVKDLSSVYTRVTGREIPSTIPQKEYDL